uniref:Uncharacterized protein n=1 Tax=Escherichia coli TaxID=562 RepID=A0A2S1PPN7_ECOLX|nr:hypothetical protein [Escherichia coli]
MCPFRGAKAPPAVHFTGVSPRSGPFRWGPFTASRDSCPGRTQNFLPGSWLKILWPVHLTLDRWNGRGYVCPRKVHSGKQAAEVAAGGKTAAPSGAVSSHTVRCAGSAGHGATEAARPERSLQARFFTHRTVATARNRASGFGGDWRVRKQLPVVVGPDDRMPPGSREPKWAQ